MGPVGHLDVPSVQLQRLEVLGRLVGHGYSDVKVWGGCVCEIERERERDAAKFAIGLCGRREREDCWKKGRRHKLESERGEEQRQIKSAERRGGAQVLVRT